MSLVLYDPKELKDKNEILFYWPLNLTFKKQQKYISIAFIFLSPLGLLMTNNKNCVYFHCKYSNLDLHGVKMNAKKIAS